MGVRLIKTSKTVHVHAKHYKHNEDGRTAPGVCGNGSVPLRHSGNVDTRIGIHTRTHTLLLLSGFATDFDETLQLILSWFKDKLTSISRSFQRIFMKLSSVCFHELKRIKAYRGQAPLTLAYTLFFRVTNNTNIQYTVGLQWLEHLCFGTMKLSSRQG